jgi:hypothetical protein
MASATLASQRVTCRHLDVSVDTSQFHPGGWVAVDVACSVDLTELGALRLPATQRLSSRFVESIDRFESAG